jgi:DNA-directed RNA polymerase specialized sigma24 family protein
MLAQHDTSKADMHDFNEISWQKLYSLLRPLVKRWVYSSGVSSWKGQEDDVVDDIVQEAITRLFQYTQRAERGEVVPIETIEHMIKVVALNYCRDLKRRERRLLRSSADELLYGEHIDSTHAVDPAEIAIDEVFQEWLFERVSVEIIKFPEKQRNALLIDLAFRMHFAVQPTSLQRAFLRRGIRLQDFRVPAPKNPAEKNRHLSSLSTAYKRLNMIPVK